MSETVIKLNENRCDFFHHFWSLSTAEQTPHLTPMTRPVSCGPTGGWANVPSSGCAWSGPMG